MHNSTMKVGSLFAGVGGFDLGFERAGCETAWTVEIDPKARAVLRHRFPDAAHHSDITTLNPDDLEPVDVITYGFPCQDLSVAGKRRGLAGERSGLFYHATRIIRSKRPRYSIAENVPGLFSSNEGRDFAAVLGELESLGTDTAWRTLDSQWFGVAQRRRRVFIVTDTRGERAGEILSLTEGLSGYPAPSRKEGKGIASTISARPQGGGGLGTDAELDGALIPEVAACLTSRSYSREDYETETFCVTGDRTHALTNEGHDASEDGTGRGTPIVSAFDARQSDFLQYGDKTGPLDTDGNSVAVAFDPHATLCADPGGPCSQDWKTHVAVISPAVRRLTPVECCRLQGFPDDWNAWGIDDQGKRIEMSDSARYKQMGNAVTVSVAHWIAKQVLAAHHNG